jgi:arylsulfatase A-like enzyme
MSVQPDRRPNVIWIFGDQHRAQACSYRGDPNVITPNIDFLARDGMRFDNAVAGAPWCCPFRAALLTGLYPHQNGVTSTPGSLDPAIPTITAPFKEAGYRTLYVGKWHLDGGRDPHQIVPPERRGGFDYWMAYENNNNQYETYLHGTDAETPQRLPGYEVDVLTDVLLDQVDHHLAGSGGGGDYQPFFGVVSYQPPHNPYVAPHNPAYPHSRLSPTGITQRPNVPRYAPAQEQVGLALAGYYGMIENIDYNLGRIRERLMQRGIDRETYLVFFSDHGDMVGSHGQWGKSAPWEEAIRVPFVVGTVGGAAHMQVGATDAVINHVDIAATTLGLCGIEVPATMQGYDYSSHCIHHDRAEYRGAPDASEEPATAYLQQVPRKLHAHTVNREWRGVVTRDGWKYVCMPGHEWLLHHLPSDPYEQANLAYDSTYQGDKERLQGRLQQWIVDTADSFDLPDITL